MEGEASKNDGSGCNPEQWFEQYNPPLMECMLRLSAELRNEKQPESELDNWDDPITCKFKNTLHTCMHEMLKKEVDTLVANGYTKEDAEKAMSIDYFYTGEVDLVSTTMDNAINYSEEWNEIANVFNDFQSKIEYISWQMVNEIKDIKPSFSVAQAIWTILVCKLNLSKAISLSEAMLIDYGPEEISQEFIKVFVSRRQTSESQSSKSSFPNNIICRFQENSPPDGLECSKNYEGLPYDDVQEIDLPRDEMDEYIIKLVSQLQSLEEEMQSYSDWANQNVLLAAQVLKGDKAEIERLRKEKKEAVNKENEKLKQENDAKKRLSELESLIKDANARLAKGKTNLTKLKQENLHPSKKLEAITSRYANSVAKYKEAEKREEKSSEEVKTLETKKGLLHGELKAQDSKMDEVQKEVTKTRASIAEIEVKFTQERTSIEEATEKIAHVRKQREELKDSAKQEANMIRITMEQEKDKYIAEIHTLERKISEKKLEHETSRIAALRMSNMEPKSSYTSQCQERECVMCLNAEICVVFMPCAHQVLCVECNNLHESRGMKECPSCRTQVQRRIKVKFAN